MAPQPDTALNTAQQEDATAKRSSPLLFLTILIFLVTIGTIGFVYYQDWKQREADRAEEAERVKYEIGPGNPPTPENFRPVEVVDQQPIVRGFKFLHASKTKDQIGDEELVLAVQVNGKTRAYPINMLHGPTREIINDRLGDRDIAATW